ncbi:MAG: STAS domain-containing protein [Candidatus Omnitrophica bacterium]|nr:STAS domain-containing protein [Candidatus Omnitrophota bacterium]
MDVKTEKINDVALVVLAGELNMDNSNTLRVAFKKILKENSRKILVDFEKLVFIDSSGIATLIEMFQNLGKLNGRMCLCNVNKRIIGVFEVTKVQKLFNIFVTREEALRSFCEAQ